MSEPKTVERRIAFRKANKSMPRRRIDKFTSETGKILPRKLTGISAKMHRKITREIKRARTCNLLP